MSNLTPKYALGTRVQTREGSGTIEQIDDSGAHSTDVMYFVNHAPSFGAGWVRESELDEYNP